jgi:DNA invertase Pin-like site-specific DNA recombinase
VKAGLARARANGKTLGRAKVSGAVEDRIRGLAPQGIGKVKTARMLGVGVSVVQRVFRVE